MLSAVNPSRVLEIGQTVEGSIVEAMEAAKLVSKPGP
jgi:hypothetical protein